MIKVTYLGHSGIPDGSVADKMTEQSKEIIKRKKVCL